MVTMDMFMGYRRIRTADLRHCICVYLCSSVVNISQTNADQPDKCSPTAKRIHRKACKVRKDNVVSASRPLRCKIIINCHARNVVYQALPALYTTASSIPSSALTTPNPDDPWDGVWFVEEGSAVGII